MRFTLLAPSILLALAACVPTTPKSDDVEDSATDTLGAPAEDEDNDGFLSHLAGGSDCDDEDASVNPAAEEVCDGVDNNCDGSIDDGLSVSYWADGDGDGFGAGEPLITCEPPGAGWATAEGDCDDADPTAFPGADVACEDADKNCDGLADNIDGDTDGFAGCEECDDTQAGTFPGAVETCDDVDQDCDGQIDEDAADAAIWRQDDDGDGFGDASVTLAACDQPEGYVSDDADCDDADATISPDGVEVCDGLDNDCDGEIDGEGATGTRLWYADADGDGYGDPNSTADSCEQPSGFVLDNTDCDDTDADVRPGAVDAPYDGLDADCSGGSDNDGDGDGYDSDSYGGLDCDDADAAVSPGAAETYYDGVDANCDGKSDHDADEDGYDTLAAGGQDCDDSRADAYPGAAETYYDGVDANCDGLSDYDADGDGYDALSSGGSDCDDSTASVRPGAAETFYDGVDTNCDGLSDYDADGDGHDGEAWGGADCDDATASVSPDAAETYYDGLDADCDGKSDYDADADGYDSDAWGGADCDDTKPRVNPGMIDAVYDGVDADCDGGSDYDADGDGYDSDLYGGDDCDDKAKSVSPAATETYYDGLDADCDGLSDYDADGDGYDSDLYSGDDCDDADADISPAATELPGDGLDQNCEGNDGPSVSLSDTSGVIVALEGYATESTVDLLVSNGGEGSLLWEAEADEAWVTLSDTSGAGGDALLIGADASGLAAGSYTATVTVTEATGGLDTQTLALTLHVAETFAGDVTTSIVRDPNGDIAEMTDPLGVEFSLSRDGEGRITEMSASTGEYVAIDYDEIGQPTTYETDEGALSLAWTVDGGLDKITWPDASVTDYTWDASGRVSSVTLPSGDTLSYAYTSSKSLQPDRVLSSAAGVVTLTYDKDGRVKTRTTTRSKTTWTYDSVTGKPASIAHTDAKSAATLSLAYTYNSRGLISTRTLTDKSGTTTLSYSYDGDGRLTEVSSSAGGSVRYTYDDAGNRATMTLDGETTSYLVDSDDRLLQAGDEVFEYDEAGRLTRRLSPEADVSYTWDAFGRLIEVDDGVNVVQYTYAGNGTRLTRTHDGVTTRYYHDLSMFLPHLHEAEIDDGSSVSTASFVWAGGSLAFVQVDTTGYATLTDHAGSVLGLTGVATTQALRFDAFGAPEETPSLDDPFLWMGFTGEEADPVTGLIYLRDRYYDPRIGRFISPDSATPDPLQPESWNSYVYCENDPVNFIDPTGDIDWGTFGGGLMTLAGGIASMAALAAMGPAVGVGAAVLGAYVAITAASGIGFGLAQIIAGLAAPDGTKVEMPGGILETVGAAIKGNMTDPNQQAAVDAIIKAIDMSLPGPDKLAGLPEKIIKQLEALDKLSKIKDAKDFLEKHQEVMDRLKKENPEAWKILNERREYPPRIPADDERGGVYINATATVLADLTQIDGAAVDPATGQLVLHGRDGGVTVEGIDGDMLYTALQWLYDSAYTGSFVAPGVTIENDLIPPAEPTPPTSDDVYHGVGYFGGIEYTEAGFAAFEADRMLKSLNLGVDSNDTSIEYDWLSDYVTDYESCVAIEEDYYNGTSPAGWVRFWIEPDQMILTEDSTRSALEFTTSTMHIQYEDQTDALQRWPAYDYWTTMLTNNYDGIAEHVESWEDLRTASKFVAVAYWLYESELYRTLDWAQINSVEEEVYDTPWWTLEGEVTSTFVYNGTPLTQTHKGGASLTTFGHGYYPDSTGSVAADWDAVLGDRPSDEDSSWLVEYPDGETGVAVALPLSRVPMPGGARQSVVDLRAPSVGELPLELRRSYSSVAAQAGRDMGLGAGWSFVPYSARPSEMLTKPGSFDVPFVLDVMDHLTGAELRFEYTGWDGALAYFTLEGQQDQLTLDSAGTYTWSQPGQRTVELDEEGRVQSVMDRAGNTLTYTWTGDELDLIEHSGGHSITLTWDSAGRLKGASTDQGWTVSYGLNTDDHLNRVTDLGGQTWRLSYDSAGLYDSLVSPDGDELWAAEYDSYGRLLSETSFGRETELAPSLLDGTLLSLDETGVGSLVTFDESGRLTSLIDGEGGEWSMTWDDAGLLTELTDALGNAQTVQYNDYDLPWILTDAEGGETALYWTWVGELPALYAYSRPDGEAFYLARDTDGNVTTIYGATLTLGSDGSLSGLSVGSAVQTMSWTSDGQLSTWSKGALSMAFTYTSDGQLKTMTDLLGGSRTYSYDSAGRLSAVTSAEGVSLSYTYDTTHPTLYSTISQGSTVIGTFEYDSLGRMIAAGDAEGNELLWTYGDDGLLSAAESPEGGLLVYSRDDAGRVTAAEGSWGLSRSWTYDDAGRVTSSTRAVVLP